MRLHTAVLAAALMLAPAVLAQTPPAPPDPDRMSRDALENEVRAARPYLQFGGVNTARPPGCTAPEYRQFDFWIGEWDVSPAGSAMVIAESTIRPLDQGCSIFEEWRPFASAGGHSISSYDSTDGAWHQEWVDGNGRRTPFSGGFENGVMYLDNLGPPPPNASPGLRRRMNYQRIDEDTVRQWGEQFDEASQSWVVTWDFTYRRRPGTR